MMPRRLHEEIAPRLMHEIEHDQVRAARDAVERRRIARIEFSRPMTESVVPSTRTSRTTLIAIGLGRTGERTANVPRGSG